MHYDLERSKPDERVEAKSPYLNMTGAPRYNQIMNDKSIHAQLYQNQQ